MTMWYSWDNNYLMKAEKAVELFWDAVWCRTIYYCVMVYYKDNKRSSIDDELNVWKFKSTVHYVWC